MTLSFVEITHVIDDAAALDRLVYRPLLPPLAAQIGGRWILLDERRLEELLAAMRSGRSASDVLADWEADPAADRDVAPPVPSLVFEEGRVVGAWIEVAPGDETAVHPPPLRRSRTGWPEVPGRAPSAAHRRVPGAPPPDAVPRLRRRGGPPPATAPAPGEPAAPEATAEQTLDRTPHLDAPSRIAKAPGTEFTVSVYADTKELAPDESGDGIAITLPSGIDRVDVAVLLQVTPHFEVVGNQFGELTLATKEPVSNRLEFKLRVLADAPDGEAAIGVLFNYRGRSCGYVSRAWTWDTGGHDAVPAEAQAATPTSIPVHAGTEAPDLSVFITAPLNDQINYMCAIETPLLSGYERATSSRPFAVPAQGYGFLKQLLAALVNENQNSDERLDALTEIGHEAFEAAPPNFREVLWAMVDASRRPESIYIASAEPTIPWELMIPRRFDGKQPRRLGPLGTEFAIGRWTRGDVASPPQDLAIDSAFVIAPDYETEARQLDASAEIEFVKRRLKGKRIKPATTAGLNRRFQKEHAALLHFVCHGAAGQANDDAIWLDHDEQLRARRTETLEGFQALFDAKKPLVFMNACEAGQGVPSLGGGSGFPRSFGNLGARAVIAPLWPVDDTLASKIALELYDAALKPGAPPVAAILRDMRKRGYAARNVDTFAAYCFYGDPLARLQLIDS
jgi:hypothetical protein